MTKSKKPEIGQRYDRKEIYEMFGGNQQSALPFKDGRAVCGCYDPQMNPNAPKEILVGIGINKEYYSQQLADEKYNIPIFLKRAKKEYEFVGYYRATRYSTDRDEVKKKNTTYQPHRPHNTIAGVLYFEEAKNV